MVGVYTDHHVHGDIVRGLRQRGVDCLTAAEDGHRRADDEVLLARATALGRVLFSMDLDLLAITSHWLAVGQPFAGLIYARQLGITMGQAVSQVHQLVRDLTLDDFRDQVFFLPL